MEKLNEEDLALIVYALESLALDSEDTEFNEHGYNVLEKARLNRDAH